MTRILHLTVGPDGRVAIPGAQPGQIVTLKIIGLTEPTGRTDNIGPIPDDEWAAIEARVKQRARRMRQALPEPWLSSNHGDLLYGRWQPSRASPLILQLAMKHAKESRHP